MIRKNDLSQAFLKPDTRVLFQIGDTAEYIMTNDSGVTPAQLRVFTACPDGKILSEGYRLADRPSVPGELKPADRTFADLAPGSCERTDPVTDGLLGLAVGDAFGVPLEFLPRSTVQKLHITEMLGCDCDLPFTSRWGDRIPRGAWSDDTAMTVASMTSIVEKNGEIDFEDIMKHFILWWNANRYSSLDFSFGLGNNIKHALDRFQYGMQPALQCGGKDFRDNGNGALMRMFPFSIYCIFKEMDDGETLDLIRKAAGITHANEINAMCCYVYTQFLFECLRTKNPALAYRCAVTDRKASYGELFSVETMEALALLFDGLAGSSFDKDRIRESGYVVDSLLTALYSVLHTENFENAILTAVGFGYDTDTNAAITGSIAGAMYARKGIPARWLSVLRKQEELTGLAKAFSACIG